MDDISLAREALRVREMAWVPYSGFSVGAALLTAEGKVYLGCNIENASYTPTVCAERVAIFKAVSEGERQFAAIAVTGGPKGAPANEQTFPCGVCRQVMMEFCVPEQFRILVVSGDGSFTVHTLSELLPYGFGPADLKR